MWNDEDNNPYGTSFDRRDSNASSSANPTSPGGGRNCKANFLSTRVAHLAVEYDSNKRPSQFRTNARIRQHQAARTTEQISAVAEALKMAKTTEKPMKEQFQSGNPAVTTVASSKFYTRTRSWLSQSPTQARAWKAEADISSTPSAPA